MRVKKFFHAFVLASFMRCMKWIEGRWTTKPNIFNQQRMVSVSPSVHACCHMYIKYLTIIAVLCTIRLWLCLNTSPILFHPQFKSKLLIFFARSTAASSVFCQRCRFFFFFQDFVQIDFSYTLFLKVKSVRRCIILEFKSTRGRNPLNCFIFYTMWSESCCLQIKSIICKIDDRKKWSP